MSWIYLPGQAVGRLEQNTYLDGKRLSTSKKTKGNRTSSEPESKTATLTTLPFGAMSTASPSTITNAAASSVTYAKYAASLWLSRVFRASHLAWPAECLPTMTRATDGLTPFALLKKSGQQEYFWRTFQDSLLAHTGITARYSETWPRAGMMQNGVCYRLPMLAHPTAEKDSGLWPTPTVIDAGSGRVNTSNYPNATPRPTLAMMARRNLWPTPKATRRGDCPSEWARKTPDLIVAVNQMSNNWKNGSTAVRLWLSPGVQGMNTGSNSRRKAQREGFYPSSYPTPSPTDYRTGYRTDTEAGIAQREKRSKPLRDDAAAGGQLNPDWVEWLMGWPIGWTSTEPLPETAVSNWLSSMQSGDWWEVDPADVGDVPRTKKDITRRIARLFATGNGQVPLVAVLAWRLLAEGE